MIVTDLKAASVRLGGQWLCRNEAGVFVFASIRWHLSLHHMGSYEKAAARVFSLESPLHLEHISLLAGALCAVVASVTCLRLLAHVLLPLISVS